MVFKWQSNTKFCNQFYRNLLSNGALTFLFGDASDGFYFILCFLILQLIKSMYEQHMVKDILYRIFNESRTEHTDLKNPSGIYGANNIIILSLLYIILFK